MSHSHLKHKYQDEEITVKNLLATLGWTDDLARRTSARAASLITDARNMRRKPGEIETFLREYGLNTEEGRALMTLAEALLRVPDSRTADALIRDKLDSAAWPRTKTDDWMLKATALGLKVTKKTLNTVVGRLGESVVRAAIRQAMKIMGSQFVVGRTIQEAMKNARSFEKDGYLLSYDMLGEGARTAKDAERYYESYVDALERLSAQDLKRGTGISVKLSALHPRYEVSQKDRCLPVLIDRLTALCKIAKDKNLRVTVDAEEADRLELSLEIIEAVALHPELKSWTGFGLAVQAYQKRAREVIEKIVTLSKQRGSPLHVRLVKGAYWDTEIKHAQVVGLPDYPVFTRKPNTDLSYLSCAALMLENREHIYCLFGTHNAHTIASIIEMSMHNFKRVEFQRLHGMGENLYAALMSKMEVPVSIYAPVGPHKDLLAYLVRRLLENGANSSFVHRIFDENYSPETLSQDVVEEVKLHPTKKHSKIPAPHGIFPLRKNSKGIDLNEPHEIEKLEDNFDREIFGKNFDISLGKSKKKDALREQDESINPSDHNDVIGKIYRPNDADIDTAFEKASEAFHKWNNEPSTHRADILNKAADLLEERMDFFIGICAREAGKTLDDGIAEVREAIDFCRYYAQQGVVDFDKGGIALPSVTGEDNRLLLSGRGVFVCISPWNFPLAIFTGQVAAALMAGNTVIAKPAEQTPVIAHEMVKLLHEAGIPKDALHYVPGDGSIGAKLIAHKNVSGVVFTGSTQVAKHIQRALADKDGAIVPLIAETGGLNAMIVDSSALAEQVIDDVVTSAFGSTGQRCSALRILCLQDDVADKMIEMLAGAMAEIRIGNPSEISTDLGPVIDQEALDNLLQYCSRMDGQVTKIAEASLPDDVRGKGTFFAPVAYEIPSLDVITHEVFGPILHIYRYKAKDRKAMLAELNAKNYGLTFGIHSRISSHIDYLSARADVGNVYVNRSMIGAVVGSQPFGGRGLSGTGPKAGGPFYLHAFATEKTVTINTTASGGNAKLVSLEE